MRGGGEDAVVGRRLVDDSRERMIHAALFWCESMAAFRLMGGF